MSIVFTLLVIANFVAMIGGPPPAWLTYAPLVPLLLMMLTGLAMLGQHFAAVSRQKGPPAAPGSTKLKGIQ